MIRFEKASFAYEAKEPVLSSVDLELGPGLILLLGLNGSGKSTLLKLAAGVEIPDTGRILVDRFDLWKDEVEARRSLVFLPEHPDLTPYATLREILNLVCRLRGEPLEKGVEALEFFSLERQANRSVRELSMGQRRRATFAAAIIGSPKHILLDEPLEAMDRKIQKEILGWITAGVGHGAVVVVVSHLIEPFLDIATQAVGIKEGRVEAFKQLPQEPSKRKSLLERLAKGECSEGSQ